MVSIIHNSQFTIKNSQLFSFINIVDAEQCSGEGAGLAKSDEQGGVDFSLRVDEDATEEKDEASEGKDGSGE